MGEEVAPPGHTLPEDAKRRNQIRKQVLSNFISVNVWLLPPPVELTSATTRFSAHGTRRHAVGRLFVVHGSSMY